MKVLGQIGELVGRLLLFISGYMLAGERNKRKQAQGKLKGIKKREKVSNDVRDMSDDDLDKRLRKYTK